MKSIARATLHKLSLLLAVSLTVPALAAEPLAPIPLLSRGQPVDWWFVFKFNTKAFPECGGAQRKCIFGGDVQTYNGYGQQYVYASSVEETLTKGSDCAGDTLNQPIGATFDQVYNGSSFYVVWNDQFYDDPKIPGCSKECGSPWGHSKGLVAWNSDGVGVLMQVSTPSWPASGSIHSPRQTDGNTLGCVKDDNVKVSQHFFALKLSKPDLVKVLAALGNASVVTNPNDPQVVNNGGPADVQEAVRRLGKKSASKTFLKETLSTGVQLISKPSKLTVPPWQMVSALLGGASLRSATWWYNPKIFSTTEQSSVTCWDQSIPQSPGPVEIATAGQWHGKKFGLTGGAGLNFNHAKVGVSTSGNAYTIFGDMNQQGTIAPGDRPCTSSQNGRGGLFYVLGNRTLHDEISKLIAGDSAPTSEE